METTIPPSDMPRRRERSLVVVTEIILVGALVFVWELAGRDAYLARVGGFLFGVASARIFEGFRRISEWET